MPAVPTKALFTPHNHADPPCLLCLDSVHYVPTGDNIARFIETISAKCIPSYRDKPAVSLTSIRNAVLNVYARLQFKHKLLNFSRHNFKRIDTVLDRLVKEGKLTPGRWRKRQRAGVALVRLLGQAWFTDCLTHGCRSWDVTISRFLSISLMAATAGRAGDIVRSKGYTGLEYLRWEHVELVLGGHDDGQSPTIQGMTASITMK